MRADGFKPNTEAIGDRMVQLKGIDKALPGLAAQANILTLTHPHLSPFTLALTTLRGQHLIHTLSRTRTRTRTRTLTTRRRRASPPSLQPYP